MGDSENRGFSVRLLSFFSLRGVDGNHRLMACIVLFWGLFSVYFGEIVPTRGGLGWDGVTYADMTRNLGALISDGNLSRYYAQRILPSTVVRAMLIVAQAPISDANIIRGFGIFNLLVLLSTAWAWKRIADHCVLSLGGRWIGFAAIFVNFVISKQIMYVPVVTDAAAMFIHMLLLLFYLERRPLLLFLATIAGSFTWPATAFYGALLLGFMHIRLPPDEASPLQLSRRVAVWWASLLFVSIIGYVLLKLAPSYDGSRQLRSLARLFTGSASLAAVVLGILMLIGSSQSIRSVLASWRSIGSYLPVLAALCIVIPWAVVRAISNPHVPNPSSFSYVLKLVFYPLNGEGKFLMPLVTLTLVWGPALLLMVICWKEICVQLRRLGPGVMAVVGLTLPLALVNEPRFVLGGWPFAVLALVLALEGMQRSRSFRYVFTALSIGYAQFWMKINVAPWTGGDSEGLLEFPKQLLFMHYGPWMSWPSYLTQLPVVVLSGLLLKSLLGSSRRDATKSRSS